MRCAKCGKEYDSGFKFCPWCGQKSGTAPARKPRKRANGMGSVFKLNGRRRKPWAAMVSRGGERILVGCFAEKREALAALEKFHNQPIPSRYNATLEDIYNEWKATHFLGLTAAGVEGYETAWKRLSAHKGVKMRDVRTELFQDVINNACTIKGGEERPLSRSGKEKIRQLCSQLCKHAVQNDIIDRNYAEFIKIHAAPPAKKEIFTASEIERLEQDDSRTARIILTLIYSGMRINELFGMRVEDVHLEDGYMIGGEKTEAGKNRVIPIHPKVKTYVEEWIAQTRPTQEYLITNAAGKRINDDNFRNREYYPTLDRLGIPRKNPHCTRHTFATWMRQAGVREEVLIDIMGHSNFGNTQTYLHDDIEQLKQAISSI